jgi:hypothetical protein
VTSRAHEAFELLCSSQSQEALDKVVRSLAGDDIAQAALKAASSCLELREDPAETFDRLKLDLAEGPGTVIVAMFRSPPLTRKAAFGRIQFCPPEELVAENGLEDAAGGVFAAAELAVRVEDPGGGSRGARRALQWLRAGLGALYLAANTADVGARVGPVPADDFAPALFVGGAGNFGRLVETLRIHNSVPANLDQMLLDAEAVDLIGDCLQDFPDFVSSRLWLACSWLEVAFDALSFPDAALALGIALEALVGAQGPGDTVKTVSTRTAFLMRDGSTADDRALSALDWRDRTKSVYKARSAVAHGRYAEGDAAKEAKHRSSFEELVCQVAVKFRCIGREEGWESDADMQAWQERLELA